RDDRLVPGPVVPGRDPPGARAGRRHPGRAAQGPRGPGAGPGPPGPGAGDGMSTAAISEPGLQRLVGFGRLLRSRGLPVGTGRILTFCRAVAALERIDRTGVYWAGRIAMVARKEDLAAYDAAFAEWFPSRSRDVMAMISGQDQRMGAAPELEVVLDRGLPEESWPRTEGGEGGGGPLGVRASGAEVLRAKSFDELSDDERVAADHVIRALAVHLPTRHSRRYRPSPYGRRFDPRRPLRARPPPAARAFPQPPPLGGPLRTGGDPSRRAGGDRRRRVRPLVLI